jgi:CheY-specific phosphatase CheX
MSLTQIEKDFALKFRSDLQDLIIRHTKLWESELDLSSIALAMSVGMTGSIGTMIGCCMSEKNALSIADKLNDNIKETIKEVA